LSQILSIAGFPLLTVSLTVRAHSLQPLFHGRFRSGGMLSSDYFISDKACGGMPALPGVGPLSGRQEFPGPIAQGGERPARVTRFHFRWTKKIPDRGHVGRLGWIGQGYEKLCASPNVLI
jgi:hypothetical protein